MKYKIRLTYVQDVQGGDVRDRWAQLIGRLNPNLVRGEEGEVARDVAGVTLFSCAVVFTLFLSAVPPATTQTNWSGPDVLGFDLFRLPWKWKSYETKVMVGWSRRMKI